MAKVRGDLLLLFFLHFFYFYYCLHLFFLLFDRQNSICVGVAAWVEGLMRKRKKKTNKN